MNSAAGDISVVVVSRGRPKHLMLCLSALAQQVCSPFEVIVVADTVGAAAIRREGLDRRVKLREFEEANISAARNLGLDLAAGKFVAFVDDDAAAEPTWLQALVAPFENSDVVATTGYVRGRNGVCFQSKAQMVDVFGKTHDLDCDGDDVFFPNPARGQAVKTVGTNCAFRRSTLLSVGGFDESMRFYLEDADLNLRISGLGRTAIVPQAQVHHAFAASDQRTTDRVPRTLVEIGRSTSIFLRRHAPSRDVSASWAALMEEQRARLLRHMVAGRLLPADVERLLRGLFQGWQEGRSVPFSQSLTARSPSPCGFLVFVTDRVPSKDSSVATLSLRMVGRSSRLANRISTRPARTILAFDMTPRPLRVSYIAPGVWLHRCGLFGRVVRNAPRVSFRRYRQRVADEMRRIATLRGLSPGVVKVL